MLDVYLYGEAVGRLEADEHGSLSFRYTARALEEPDRFALSVRLPVRPEPYGHRASMAFFDNLLPESDARDLIAQARHHDPSDVAGLLGAIGGECAGAVSLWPEGTAPPAEPRYRLSKPEEVGATYDRRYSADPLADLTILARWAFVNLVLGNNDAHAKNLSLLYTARGIRLAPIYDVLSTHVYPHIDRHLALDVGGQRTADGMDLYAAAKFARSLGMKPRALARIVAPAVERASTDAPDVLHGIAAAFGDAPVLDAIAGLIAERTTPVLDVLRRLEARG